MRENIIKSNSARRSTLNGRNSLINGHINNSKKHSQFYNSEMRKFVCYWFALSWLEIVWHTCK